MSTEFLDFMSFIEDWSYDYWLDHYTDEELKNMVNNFGITKAISKILFNSFEKCWILKIKKDLDLYTKNNWLSNELNEFINTNRAKLIYETWVSIQTWEDDRLWINMDNLLANFKFDFKSNNKRENIKELWELIWNWKNEIIGDFIMRTPEDYLKVLIYYLKLKSIDDLHTIFNSFFENKLGIRNEWINIFEYWSYFYYHFQESLKHPVEFISTMLSPELIEWFLKNFNIDNVDNFNKLFIENHYMFPFITIVDIELLQYFTLEQWINNINDLLKFLSDENIRNNILWISKYWSLSIKNTLILLNNFNLKDSLILNEFDYEFLEILSKISINNLNILLEVFECNCLSDFKNIFSNKYIIENIEDADYNNLKITFSLLWLSDTEFNKEVSNIIWIVYNKSISYSLEELNKTLVKFKGNLWNLKDYLLKLISWNINISENTKELIKVIENLKVVLSHNQIGKYIDFSRLNLLSSFMWGNITFYLSNEVLKTDNLEWLFGDWRNIISSFLEWNFDSENELHRNLEYKKFKELNENENITKYMEWRFWFNDYLYIFDWENRSSNFSKIEKFELECIFYEASLLKKYILEINQKAKQLWRKVLIIPNLSYWYLPVSAIIDELDDNNIDFLIGTKVWSTECHNNSEILNSKLFKWKREQIINEQPIIIVVDWTKDLIPRNGDWKWARYPDAYQWYLNHVIAMNYINGNNDIEKMNYIDNWKSKSDLKMLIKTDEFQRTIEIYKNLLKSCWKQYRFWFWNTSWKDLIIRWWRSELNKLSPLSAESLNWPTMIFCNIWVLNEQLPDNLRRDDIKHIPAYFDDSWKIISFEYSFNNTWINIVNSIELELKKLAWKDLSFLSTNVSIIIEYIKNSVSFWE